MSDPAEETRHPRRGHLRRRGRAAMMKGVFFLPSLATLGNAICGFAAMYVTTLAADEVDPLAEKISKANLMWAAYLVFFAAIFDVLDGRLARLTRHTTDFGGQLDSLADVISFGAAPAFIALQLFKAEGPALPVALSRLIWAIGALYLACTAMRLARFNVTNEHGEQHHRSFQGCPSPAAGLAVLAMVLLFVQLDRDGFDRAAFFVVCMIPVVLLSTALLMVSEVRYPHLMNTAFKGRKSIWKVVVGLMLLLLLVVEHRYTVSTACLLFILIGPVYWLRYRKHRVTTPAADVPLTSEPAGLPPTPPA
jgi:CDP-diacylglycerol---serine O-phosphatidyltransferase